MTETPEPQWLQVHLHLADRTSGERLAVRDLAPALAILEANGTVASWHYLRKGDRWRLRYLPPHKDDTDATITAMDAALERCRTTGMITGWTVVIYEPETHAFGGAEGMEAAHRLFHQDSQQVMSYLHAIEAGELDDQRSELSVLLAAAMMRGAGLDWYEIGDTWAKIGTNRPTDRDTRASTTLRNAAGILLTSDTNPTSGLIDGGPLAFAEQWLFYFTDLGRTLRTLTDDGRLQRGLRSVLAHHYLFHANRLGLSHQQQALLAAAAADTVLELLPDQKAAAS
ncbi:thiopeptide-type bacteriocin biosynthesis protein [Kitasatospora sp. NPDC094015]|uniref:thiopeptide-type bacteriocin biosynthesis protein n=1 Tax=Kitasatospora sp. NPDC094015 TaxID=3155205 RepID=UPI0033200035